MRDTPTRPVAVVAGAYPPSLVNFRGDFLRAVGSAGWHVIGVAGRQDPETQVAVEGLGAEYCVLPITNARVSPWRDIVTLSAFFRLFRISRPTVFLGYTIKPVVYGILAAWLAGVPRRYALVTGLGFSLIGEAKSRQLVRTIVKILYRLSLSRAHKVFFQNPDDEALFRQWRILPSRVPSVVVNGSGVDTRSFPVAAQPKVDIAVFLMIGRLLGDKGVREYVGAARKLKARYPGAKFCLAGWIDENPNSIRPAELDDWVREGVIEFMGKLDDVRPAIAGCSVYVLPSYREGLPRTVLEAMAMGRAVITTDAPGCRQTVDEGENGFLVPVKSVDALAHAMERFVREPILAMRMGQRSREIAVARFDVEQVNAVLMKEMGFV